MSRTPATAADLSWISLVEAGPKPIYLAIADAIRAAVRMGRLHVGARLPPQRQVAAALGVDLSTVTRAYGEAQRTGLVTSRVGRGTFVAARPMEPAVPAGGLVDMSMNLPPQFSDEGLVQRMWRTAAELQAEEGLGLLFRYAPPAGPDEARAAGAHWLAPRLPHATAANTVVAAGAQAALVAAIAAVAQPGDSICAEALTYPGLRAAAAHLGVSVVGAAMDAEGMIPDDLARIAREVGPKALCCTATLQNPTTATMSPARRQAIVDIARRRRMAIIEDDAYGALPLRPPPPLAALAPEISYYIGGVAKVLSPAVRIAYVVAPDPSALARVIATLRATTGMPSPITTALATRWLTDGTADKVLAAIRAETRARRALAGGILGGLAGGAGEAFHLWLQLPKGRTRSDVQAELRARDVIVVPSEAFATTAAIPEAVRVGLGAPATREDCARALEAIRDVLDLGGPAAPTVI